MVMNRLDGAYGALEIAKKKEIEGDLRRAHRAYEIVIRDFMHLSFAECSSLDELSYWLSNHPLELATGRFISLTEQIIDMPQLEWGRYFQSGNYLLIAFSHLFSALGQHDRAKFFTQIAIEPLLYSTPFWGEYVKTLWAMMQGGNYSPVFGKLKRVEKYWLHYVKLMQAAMRREGIDNAIFEVDRQFANRNRDMKLHDDPYMIDGTGEFPVKFDFRKAGLVVAVENTKLRIVL